MKEEIYWIISLCFSFGSLIISGLGIYFVFKQVSKIDLQISKMNEHLEYDKSVVRRQKALDMSREFQELISNELGFVKNSLIDHPYLQFDKEKDISKEFYEFDKEEAFRLFGVESIDEFTKYINIENLNKASLILA